LAQEVMVPSQHFHLEIIWRTVSLAKGAIVINNNRYKYDYPLRSAITRHGQYFSVALQLYPT
jgi:hypothetical protein